MTGLLRQAHKLNSKALIVDGHCDTFMKVLDTKKSFFADQPKWHMDFKRLVKSGTGIQFTAVYTPPKYQKAEATLFAMRMLASIHHAIAESRGRIHAILSKKDVDAAQKRVGTGRPSFLLAIEGGIPLAGDLSLLKAFFAAGVRSLTITHNPRNELADGAAVQKPHGLTKFGKDVVKEMQKLGMVIDVAHLAKPGVMDVLRLAKKPVISTHTGVMGVRRIPRNLDDQELKGIAAGGGVVGIFYLPAYVKRQPEPLESAVQAPYLHPKLRIKTKQVETADVRDVVDHMEYVAEKFGIDHVGLGSDFDGYGGVMNGIEDVTCIVNITAELLRRGYKDGEILKVLGGNFARVLKSALPG